MPRISVLPDTLASQVAAGEVVERPSSVLKELVENALDAGASQIEVEIRKGGTALLKVADNGHGMDKENALLSLQRHATSKISTLPDLAEITTHGFRGEALPSILSVSRFRLTSYDGSAKPATEIYAEGGTLRTIKPCARPAGTTIEIKDLFYNVPARRKFLKTEATEYAHLEHALRLSALGNPAVRYRFYSNGRLLWDLKSTQDARVRIGEFLDPNSTRELITLAPYTLGESSVLGYLLPGRLARGSSRSQTVFVNGRPVDDPVLRRAIRAGYDGMLSTGEYPVVWLWIEMPPQAVDVNVHPAKREVRFLRPTEVSHLITDALQVTLSARPRTALSPPRFLNKDEPSAHAPSPSSAQEPSHAASERQYRGGEDGALPLAEENLAYVVPPTLQPPTHWQTPAQAELPVSAEREDAVPLSINLLATFKNCYWLAEEAGGLLLISPQAARQRIAYEALKEAHSKGTLSSQALLFPLLFELDGHEANTVETHLPLLRELGIEITSFGGQTYRAESFPSLLSLTQQDSAEEFFYSLLDQLGDTPRTTASDRTPLLGTLFTALAKQAALTQSTDLSCAGAVMRELMACSLPYTTPEGHPTIIHYSERELAKKFGF